MELIFHKIKMDLNKISNYLEKELENYKMLKSSFEKIYKGESQFYDKKTRTLSSAENQNFENDFQKKLLNDYFLTNKKLEEKRNQRIIEKLYKTIIPTLEYYINQTKTQKKEILNTRESEKKNENEKKEQIKAQTNNENENVKAKQRNIQDNENNLKQKRKSDVKSILEYENERIIINKEACLYFTNCEMVYHAYCIEKLYQLYRNILAEDSSKTIIESIKDIISDIEESYLEEIKKKYKSPITKKINEETNPNQSKITNPKNIEESKIIETQNPNITQNNSEIIKEETKNMSEIINGNDKKVYKEHGRRKQKDNESNDDDENSIPF